ncbi:MAG: hypothetical protein P1Q69_12285 [Candidatus Thorarchaeota archaeon]|nr:hypothetical protein [Candidatus Thorarchaeota archaeon]
MSILISILVSSVLAVFSVSCLYSSANEKGLMALQRIGRVLSKRTWSLIVLAEVNVAALSWFLYSFLELMPFDTPVCALIGTTLNIFIFLSILSVLVVLVERGHISAPYRTIRSEADLFEIELENAENELETLEDIISRIETNPRISKKYAKEFLVKVSTRNDEVGKKSSEYLASDNWN